MFKAQPFDLSFHLIKN